MARYLQEENLSVDVAEQELFLHLKLPGAAKCFPITVRADGDCLPVAGSVFAFRNDESCRIQGPHCERACPDRRLLPQWQLFEERIRLCKNDGYTKKAFAEYFDEYAPQYSQPTLSYAIEMCVQVSTDALSQGEISQLGLVKPHLLW